MKWYRIDHRGEMQEFYSYKPGNIPPAKRHLLSGIKVDVRNIQNNKNTQNNKNIHNNQNNHTNQNNHSNQNIQNNQNTQSNQSSRDKS